MQTVLITGTNQGIGLELVKQFMNHFNVIATYRNEPSTALSEIARSENITLMDLEVTSEASIAQLVKDLNNQSIDILINNAGVISPSDQSLEKMDNNGWMHAFAVNTIAPFTISTALLPNLLQSSHPRILTISSMMAALHRDSIGMYAYRSSKAAVNKVMQTMSVELREKGVTVCPIHPGWVQTQMGGPDAEITAQESAQGIYTLAQKITLDQSGTFFTWEGDVHVW